MSVLQRTLAYIPQENYSGHDRNDPRGERSNRELTDTIIGTDKMGLIDEEKGQTEGRSIDRYYYRHNDTYVLMSLPFTKMCQHFLILCMLVYWDYCSCAEMHIVDSKWQWRNQGEANGQLPISF